MIRLIQPEPNLCGQTVVAMVAEREPVSDGFYILGKFVWNVSRDWVHARGSHLVLICVSCDARLGPGEYSLCSHCWKLSGLRRRPKDSPRLPTKKQFREQGEFSEILPVSDRPLSVLCCPEEIRRQRQEA